MKSFMILATAFGLITASSLYADSASAPSGAASSAPQGMHHNHGKLGQFFKECFQELNIPAPVRGQKPNLSAEQRNQIDACVQKKDPSFNPAKMEAERAAMKACLQSAGVQEGTKPTKEQFMACHEKLKSGN
jgi:Spy/CpxP family protein refolding chaperone